MNRIFSSPIFLNPGSLAMNHVTQLTIFGLRVVETRWKLGMLQIDLATKLDRYPSFVVKIEKGRSHLSYETMMVIADALETDVWKLTRPWKNTEKHIARTKAIIKKYNGHLPPFVRKKMQRKG